MAREPEGETGTNRRRGARLGVLGGTFDPPHVGHVSVARELADALDLDEVLWVTSYDPPHKDSRAVTPFPLRAEMARAAAGADPRFRPVELERELETPSYTVRTLEALSRARPGASLFLILGADQYASLHAWWRPEELGRLATLVVVPRGGGDGAASDGGRDPRFPARFVSVTPVDVSSSGIRRRLRAGESVVGLVPDSVLDVIRRARLYLSDDANTSEKRTA